MLVIVVYLVVGIACNGIPSKGGDEGCGEEEHRVKRKEGREGVRERLGERQRRMSFPPSEVELLYRHRASTVNEQVVPSPCQEPDMQGAEKSMRRVG